MHLHHTASDNANHFQDSSPKTAELYCMNCHVFTSQYIAPTYMILSVNKSWKHKEITSSLDY